jgi:hypothetical protein
VRDYDRLTPAHIDGPGPFGWPDRATQWSACNPAKYGALAILFWAAAIGALATAASC